jgi:hypothetical protein
MESLLQHLHNALRFVSLLAPYDDAFSGDEICAQP